MAQSQALEAQEKKELVSKEEKTVPSRYYVPNTDIHETDDALVIVMELPGVDKKDLSVDLENDVLKIDARIDFSKYEGLDPLYTEYNVGHFSRAFTLSSKIASNVFLREKSIIARSIIVAARGCLPASASAAGVKIS
jgi:HSP20 family protein